MKLEIIPICDIKPYENNPRLNDDAVAAVAESIKQCSYVQPIIVDEYKVVLAGHTRLKALKSLGYTECQCLIYSGLTDEQKKKFRYLDNKTGEYAEWDIRKLEEEIEGLDFGPLDFFDLKYEGFDLDCDDFCDATGAIEYGTEEFDNEQFRYECPECGFRFN